MNQTSGNSETSPETGETAEYSRLELDRLRKIERLRELGIDPFPARVERSHTLAEAVELFEGSEAALEGGEGQAQVRTVAVKVAGRVMARRGMGKMSFLGRA